MTWKEPRLSLSRLSDLLQVGQSAFAAAIILVPLIGIIITFLLGFPSIAIASFLSAACVFGLMSGISVIRRRRRHQKTDWNPYIWMKHWQSTARILSDKDAEYINVIRLHILRDDVSRLNWKIGWTGEGDLDVWVSNPGFRAELKTATIDPYLVLILHFDHPRTKGDRFDIEFGVLAKAKDKLQDPFHSIVLSESRTPKDLLLRLELADNLPVKSIRKEIYSSTKSPWPLEPTIPLTLDRNRTIEWSVDCRSGRKFGIRWEIAYDQVMEQGG